MNYLKYINFFLFISVICLFHLPNIAFSSQKDFKEPYYTNHDSWVNDPYRQKPPFLSEIQKEKWVPPLTKVKTSLHLYNLYDLNHNNQTFSVQGIVSMSWNGKILGWQGDEEEEIWLSFNSINNYDFEQTDWYEPYTDANNNNALSITFDGNFNAKFDYKKFPFDNQVLNIEYEADTDAYEVILKQDDNITVENNFNKMLDYNIKELRVENKIKVYPTTFGIADYDPGETFAGSLVNKHNIRKILYQFFFNLYSTTIANITIVVDERK